MSRRHELSKRLAVLADIAGILSTMRGLALMQIHLLQESLATQQRMVDSIEDIAAEFVAWHPELSLPESPEAEILILVGSEQGFCGDFNETLLRQWETARRAHDIERHLLILGQRLDARLEVAPPNAIPLPGANVAEEIPLVLARLTKELDRLLSVRGTPAWDVSILYHCPSTGALRLQRLPPWRDLPPPARRPFPPETNLPATDFLAGLLRHYLYAALNEVLYSSLLTENRQRLAQMDSALQRLDEKRAGLRLAYNAQRQEEITEEIEILLLSREALNGQID